MLVMTRFRHGAPYPNQQGMTVVEIMVGLAVGLFVLLAGAGILATFTGADRQMLLETRLFQDLRAASDVITRDIRRAGYWDNASTGVWVAGGPAVPPQNPYSKFDVDAASCDAPSLPNPVATPTAASTALCYYIAQDTNDTPSNAEMFGFKLDGGVIYAVVKGGTAKELTDSKTIFVSDFVITPSSQTIDASAFCSKTCTTNCPQVIIREFEILIKGHIPDDVTIERSLRSDVRVRNDYVSGQCPA